MNDKIFAGLATIPDRQFSLVKTIESIIDQVDILTIYFNYNPAGVPRELNKMLSHKRVYAFYNGRDIGDAGKFYTAKSRTGYYLSLDDDLTYPPDYAEKMIDFIDRYERRAIVTLHGRIIPPTGVSSYYRGTTAGYHFAREVKGFHGVHVGGSGVMGFHSDLFAPDTSAMERGDMADLYIAEQAQAEELPIIVAPHPEGWVRQNQTQGSIFSQSRTNDYHQTKLVNRRTEWINYGLKLIGNPYNL